MYCQVADLLFNNFIDIIIKDMQQRIKRKIQDTNKNKPKFQTSPPRLWDK